MSARVAKSLTGFSSGARSHGLANLTDFIVLWRFHGSLCFRSQRGGSGNAAFGENGERGSKTKSVLVKGTSAVGQDRRPHG